MTIASITNPGGYTIFAHEHPKAPVRTVHPLVSGTAVGNHHGYVQRKEVFVAWFTEADNLTSILDNYEDDGYIREGEPEITYALGQWANLKNAVQRFVKYTAS